jgi:hypothetical protein
MRIDAPSRLLDVVESLSKVPGNTTRDVWAKALEVDPKDTHQLLGEIGSVLKLLIEARVAVAHVVGDSNVKLHMAAFGRLDSTFASFNLDASANHLQQGAREALQGLQFTVDLVHRLAMASEIDE